MKPPDWTPPKKRKVIWERTKDMVAGRPRKKGVERYKNGAITHKARQEDVMSVAIAQRMKLGLDEKAAKSDLAGFTIGRLHQAGQVQKHHLEAAERYHADVERWSVLNGIGRGTPAVSKVFEMIGGMSLAGDPDPEVILKARRAVQDAHTAIRTAFPVNGDRVIGFLQAVIIRDDQISMTEAAIGSLREALNVLARHYRVPM